MNTPQQGTVTGRFGHTPVPNSPKRVLPHDMQLSNEYRFSRKHIDAYVRYEVEHSPQVMQCIDQGVLLLQDWLSKTYYASKEARLEQIRKLDLRELVTNLFVGVAYVLKPVLFTSVTAQMASRLHFDDKEHSIRTVAEILAVLCRTDVFDITKASRMASLMLSSNIRLSPQTMHYIEHSQYLPPMVCEPEELTTNRESAYLTHNDSVILKTYNHHDEDVCLDALNLQNSIPLSLDVDFLHAVEEEPPSDLNVVDDPNLNDFEKAILVRERKEQWAAFLKQSRYFYALMVGQGNRFWLTHKVCKRGRLYSQGYHINTQGTKYKKAMVELADKELVTGVPSAIPA